MGNEIVGLFLIIVSIFMLIFSLPMLQESVRTTSGSSLENETTVVKNQYSLYQILIPILPLIFFVIGVGIVWKG